RHEGHGEVIRDETVAQHQQAHAEKNKDARGQWPRQANPEPVARAGADQRKGAENHTQAEGKNESEMPELRNHWQDLPAAVRRRGRRRPWPLSPRRTCSSRRVWPAPGWP